MTASPSLIDELEDALSTYPSDKRDLALTRITDLFIAGGSAYGEEHISLFDDVIGRLAATIEADASLRWG